MYGRYIRDRPGLTPNLQHSIRLQWTVRLVGEQKRVELRGTNTDATMDQGSLYLVSLCIIHLAQDYRWQHGCFPSKHVTMSDQVALTLGIR